MNGGRRLLVLASVLTLTCLLPVAATAQVPQMIEEGWEGTVSVVAEGTHESGATGHHRTVWSYTVYPDGSVRAEGSVDVLVGEANPECSPGSWSHEQGTASGDMEWRIERNRVLRLWRAVNVEAIHTRSANHCGEEFFETLGMSIPDQLIDVEVSGDTIVVHDVRSTPWMEVTTRVDLARVGGIGDTSDTLPSSNTTTPASPGSTSAGPVVTTPGASGSIDQPEGNMLVNVIIGGALIAGAAALWIKSRKV